MNEKLENFIEELRKSLAAQTFVKMTLGNYKGSEEHLQKVLVRLIEMKKGTRLFLQYRYDNRDAVKNFDFDEGVELIRNYLETGFHAGHLFTTEHDFQLEVGKKGTRLNVSKPSFKTKPSLSHDREKKHRIDPSAYYLRALGITTDKGEIRADQRDKWKQINKFVEILDGLYEKSGLKDRQRLRIVDMGSGKGYLTFAAYDHFANNRRLAVTMTGIDTRRELIDLCNQIAAAGGFDGLKFVNGNIADFDPGQVDILVALHACDTATDDALYKGIAANASIIVAAPCCHKEIRKQMKPPETLAGILKHPVMLERTAETITDGLRSMLLEQNGYATKMFEFVATEHTPKNNMIVATRRERSGNDKSTENQIRSVLNEFSIVDQHLHSLLTRKTAENSGGP